MNLMIPTSTRTSPAYDSVTQIVLVNDNLHLPASYLCFAALLQHQRPLHLCFRVTEDYFENLLTWFEEILIFTAFVL